MNIFLAAVLGLLVVAYFIPSNYKPPTKTTECSDYQCMLDIESANNKIRIQGEKLSIGALVNDGVCTVVTRGDVGYTYVLCNWGKLGEVKK
jgi:hypothetical protein